MNNSNIVRRFVIMFCAIFCCATVMMAEKNTAADKLYSQGVALQQTMTVSAQNQAIRKFQAAKGTYNSAEKKALCDKAIALSRQLIRNINGGGGGSRKSKYDSRNRQGKDSYSPETTKTTLSLSNQSFDIDKYAKKLTITVNTNAREWTATPVPADDGSSFLTVNKKSENSFEISCGQNNSCSKRSQQVFVNAGSAQDTVTLTQDGRMVKILADKQIFELGKGSGKKEFSLWSDCDILYESNNNHNWIVEEKPDWVEITIKQKGGGNIFDKAIAKGKEKLKINDDEYGEDMIKTDVVILVGKNETQAERTGNLIIRSGDRTIEFFIKQKK